MATMKVSEKQALIKTSAVEALSGALTDAGASQIGDYTYAIPVKVEGEILYAKVSLVAAQFKDTKVTPKFDLDEAIEAYEAELAYRKAKAESTAKAKADKARAKKSK